MIQNELLPGCAVIIEGKQTIWLLRDYQVIQILTDITPIPLTADTVSRIGGMRESNLENEAFYFDSRFKVYLRFDDSTNLLWMNDRIAHHITSVHELQILIYSLTGTMPKYEVR